MTQETYLTDKGLIKQENNLYHYTNVSAMQKILSSNILLATHIQYMNDWSEYQRGYQILLEQLKQLKSVVRKRKILFDIEKWNIIKEKIKELPDKCPITAEEYNDFIIEQHRTRMELLLPEVYSVSFCGEADLLNQWTNYAKENGVCIEFDFHNFVFQCPDISEEIYNKFGKEEIDEARIYKGYRPVKIVYAENAMRDIIKKDIVAYLQEVPTKEKREIEEFWWKEIGTVFSIVPFFKHMAFAPENEIRLAVRRLSVPLNFINRDCNGKLSGFYEAKIYYMERGNILTPRLKLQWKCIENSSSQKTPVKSIIVGPGSNQEMTYRSIIHFIEHSLNNVDNISRSERKKLEISEAVQLTTTGMEPGYVTNKGIVVRKSGIPYIF